MSELDKYPEGQNHMQKEETLGLEIKGKQTILTYLKVTYHSLK